VEKQKEIIQKKLDSGSNIEEILKLCAAPGYSEHHSGRALDLTVHGCKPLAEEFDKTEAFSWLKEKSIFILVFFVIS
jgi:D-alanyl-D-alanine carboxypeptidase